MATMIDGESYVGRVLIWPVFRSRGPPPVFWPLRCLKSKMGGPTFGIEVKGKKFSALMHQAPRALAPGRL